MLAVSVFISVTDVVWSTICGIVRACLVCSLDVFNAWILILASSVIKVKNTP